jgi:hypothetical protein
VCTLHQRGRVAAVALNSGNVSGCSVAILLPPPSALPLSHTSVAIYRVVVIPNHQDAYINGHASWLVGRCRRVNERRMKARCRHVLLSEEGRGGRVGAVEGGEEQHFIWVHGWVVEPPVPACGLCRVHQAVVSSHAAILDDMKREHVLATQSRVIQDRKMRCLAVIELAPGDTIESAPSDEKQFSTTTEGMGISTQREGWGTYHAERTA